MKSQDFTLGTKGRFVKKIKNGIRRQEKPAYWVCQDLVNMERHDVAGSEVENHIVEDRIILPQTTNMPYLFKNQKIKG